MNEYEGNRSKKTDAFHVQVSFEIYGAKLTKKYMPYLWRADNKIKEHLDLLSLPSKSHFYTYQRI